MGVKDRQQELQRLLTRQARWTLVELSQALSVSRRTVIRDLHALRVGGMIIDSDSGPGGGIRLDPRSTVLRPHLRADEIVGLIVMLKVSSQLHPMPFASQANSAIRKIENTLPVRRIKELRVFLERVLVGKPSGQAIETKVGTTPENWLQEFEVAFSNRNIIHLDYQDKTGRRSSRTVEPQALIISHPQFYIVGFDQQKSAFRMFRADRIVQLTPMNGSLFQLRPIQDLKAGCPDDGFEF